MLPRCTNSKTTDKDKWIGLERTRWAKLFNVPMDPEFPANFPPLTLPNMRALCALTAITPGQASLCSALDALYHAYWVEHKETHKPDVLVEVLKGALGEDLTKNIVDLMASKGKQILAENMHKALADGAFGLPWLTCTNARGEKEGFWGVDHIGQVAAFMDLEKPKMGGWRSML